MSEVHQSVKTIFGKALEFSSVDQRTSYVDEACAGNEPLRAEVNDLLGAIERAGEFLGGGTPTAYTDPPITEKPGESIGPYKLLQQIGEGGMGVVFMAEQTEPIQRTVALKIIKPGMDTRQVIARFEAERQVLAMMDHPNIAKVLDAGTTDTGRPYFVMELVKGVPIIKYCDDHKLSIRDRLELFKPVCEAVQHAHQKGIIHRDIKPTNVLMAEYDNRAVPKVIDFGVAKATAQKLSERTMFTEFGQVIGTVEYMSPEQAKFNQFDIDTRSDIYSLGVLLYELLTGSTPFERERLRDAAFDEVLRIIREEDPPKPSTRLSSQYSLSIRERAGVSVPSSLASIAANRHTEPARLSKDVRGELDWIVMKSLEKDRNRRYETANGLGRDIERYLYDEPVQACPPSRAYRFRKFARRNKVALIVASTLVTTLIVLTVGLAISNRLIAAARKQAEADRDEKASALRQAETERLRAEKNFVTARKAVSSILTKAANGSGPWLGLSPELRKAFADETIDFYEGLLQEDSSNASLQFETAVSYRAIGEMYYLLHEYQQAEKFNRKAMDMLERLTAEYPDRIEYRTQLAYAHFLLGARLKQLARPAEAEAAYRKAIDLYDQIHLQRPDDPNRFSELILCVRSLAQLQKSSGSSNDAAQTIKRLRDFSSEIRKGSAGEAALHGSIGIGLMNVAEYDDAIREFDESIRLSPDSAQVHGLLGDALSRHGRLDEAVVAYRKSIELNPKIPSIYLSLGATLKNQKKYDEAIPVFRKATELTPQLSIPFWNLGVCEYRTGNWQGAIKSLEKSSELSVRNFSNDWFYLAMAHWQLGEKDEARKWFDKAVDWMEKNAPSNQGMQRQRKEAAELLGIADSQPAAKAKPNTESSQPTKSTTP